MNRNKAFQLSVALLAFSAVGVSATTIESTLTTDANDVIDLDYDQVPIGQDDASSLLDEIQGANDGNERSHQSNPSAESPPDSTAPQASGDSAEATGGSDGGEASQAQSQRQSQQRSQQSGTKPVLPSLLDRLLALLTALLPWLLTLAVVLAAIGLFLRYRDRLLAVLEDESTDDDRSTAADETDPFDGPTAHAVERAWVGMVRQLDLDRPETLTPSECARVAIDAGLDRESVRSLTRTYEEVRYGDRPVTERRERIARQSHRRFAGEGSQPRFDAGGDD